MFKSWQLLGLKIVCGSFIFLEAFNLVYFKIMQGVFFAFTNIADSITYLLLFGASFYLLCRIEHKDIAKHYEDADDKEAKERDDK
jgi:hypothetical protein